MSWNLALFERSAQAPLYWEASATEAVVRDTVLAESPDVVLYQELPGLVPYVESHEMVRANPRSHSGHLATLATAELMAQQPSITVIDGCALLTTFNEPSLTIANVHLVPGKGAGPDRIMQISEIIKASPTKELVIVGDTNMRVEEAEEIVALGFTGDKPPHVTWDSRRNRFRRNMPEFSAYFTRWFASPGVNVHDVVVHRAPIDMQGYEFFISDHFAMSGSITVES